MARAIGAITATHFFIPESGASNKGLPAPEVTARGQVIHHFAS